MEDPFKSVGGIIPESEYNAQMKFWLETIDSNFQNLFTDKAESPTITIQYINNSAINATVAKVNKGYFIGIYLGYIIVINDLFFRMLSSPNVLSGYGDISKEKARKIFTAAIPDANTLYIVSDEEEAPHPVNEIRTQIAIMLSAFCVVNVVLHEYAHVILGHVDYSLKHFHENGYYENTEISPASGPEPLFRQYAELEADTYAVNLSLHNLLSQNFVLTNNKLEPYLKDPIRLIFLWNFALYANKRIFGYKKYDYNELDKLSHPPAGLRQHVVMALIKGIVKLYPQYQILNSEIDFILRDSVLEAEKAFVEVSEQAFDMEAYEFVFNPAMEEHFQKIKAMRNEVMSAFEPYKFIFPVIIADNT